MDQFIDNLYLSSDHADHVAAITHLWNPRKSGRVKRRRREALVVFPEFRTVPFLDQRRWLKAGCDDEGLSGPQSALPLRCEIRCQNSSFVVLIAGAVIALVCS